MDRPSMYDAVGGDTAFLAVATAFHQRCLADPLLEHPFSHVGNPDHVPRLAAYWGEVLGGPPAFTEACGGDQSGMQRLHAGNDAEHGFGPNFVACFLGALDDAGVSDDPELRAALEAYIRWAVDDVMAYNPKGSVVPDDLAIPHWSWDGLVS